MFNVYKMLVILTAGIYKYILLANLGIYSNSIFPASQLK